MTQALEHQIISALIIFLIMFLVFSMSLIHVWPRDLLFWKRTDYVYYAFSAAGILLGITAAFQNELSEKLGYIRMQRETSYRRIYEEVDSALMFCRKHDEMQRRNLEEQSYGIIRPPSEAPSKTDWLSSYLPWPLTEDDCNVVVALHGQALEQRESSFASSGADDDISHSWDILNEPYFLRKCDELEGWSRNICNRMHNSEELADIEDELTEQKSRFSWQKNWSHIWPFLIALALALRIAKIHAEAKFERERSGVHRGHLQKLLRLGRSVPQAVIKSMRRGFAGATAILKRRSR